jgi:hypothetical protein
MNLFREPGIFLIFKQSFHLMFICTNISESLLKISGSYSAFFKLRNITKESVIYKINKGVGASKKDSVVV